MLVTKETVFKLVVRDAATKVALEVDAARARIVVGYEASHIIDLYINSLEEQTAFVELVETTLETCLSAVEFFFKILTHSDIPDYFGRTADK